MPAQAGSTQALGSRDFASCPSRVSRDDPRGQVMRSSSECYKADESLFKPSRPKLRRTQRSMAFEPEMLQKQWHKNRCRGVRPIELLTLQYVYLRRAAHPTVPTLSWVDERPHRTSCTQVATKCACCQGCSRGQRVRAAAVAGRLGSLDECSQRCRGGHDAPPRHTSVVSILAAVIDEIQVSLYV